MIDSEAREEDLVLGGESSRMSRPERILFLPILSTQLPLPTRLHLLSTFLTPKPVLMTAKIS